MPVKKSTNFWTLLTTFFQFQYFSILITQRDKRLSQFCSLSINHDAIMSHFYIFKARTDLTDQFISDFWNCSPRFYLIPVTTLPGHYQHLINCFQALWPSFPYFCPIFDSEPSPPTFFTPLSRSFSSTFVINCGVIGLLR